MSEQNRAKTVNMLALAIYLEKRRFGRLRGFSDIFSAAVLADGGCFCSALEHSHQLYIRKITYIKRNGSYASSEDFWVFGVRAQC